MILFFDKHHNRGGGQVVTGELMQLVKDDHCTLGLVSPADSWLSAQTKAIAVRMSMSEALKMKPKGADGRPIVLIANTYPDALFVVLVAIWFKVMRRRVATVAIMHSYLKNSMRRQIVGMILGLFDTVLAVEPGLKTICPSAYSGEILSVSSQRALPSNPISATKHVKTFARPDWSKGLHLLPSIYESLRHTDLRLQVAIGDSLENKAGYQAKLSEELIGFLVEGSRSPAWLSPGDVYLCTSVSGEAVALTVQEALQAGCFVIAPALGALPLLAQDGMGFATYAPGDAGAAAAAVQDAFCLSPAQFSEACLKNVAVINARAGQWYVEAVDVLRKLALS